MPIVETNYKMIPLATLKDIRDNQYRSKCGGKDYYPDLIEEAIQDNIIRKSERELKEREEYEI